MLKIVLNVKDAKMKNKNKKIKLKENMEVIEKF